MILADSDIRAAILSGDLIVEPRPDEDQYSPSALDLHLGQEIRRYKPELYRTPGMSVSLSLDDLSVPELLAHTEVVALDSDGKVTLSPREFYIANTRERVELPASGRIAARVEGRSSFARLGLVVHMTAPTIHSTFRGNITLEIMNFGPFPLLVRPGLTHICQLIFERMSASPSAELDSPFQNQSQLLGGRPR